MNLDGNVLSSSTSDRGQNEKLLSDLLLRENSKSRARKLSRVLSIPLEATPRRRNDIDSLILSVSLSKARSLKPALEYNYGESIPVYLVPDWRNDEHYFNKEIDLEGIVLIDMPWMLGPSSTINEKIEQSKTRNFAVGYDVYELILLLNNSSGIRNLTYDGMSGRIIQNQRKLIRHSLEEPLKRECKIFINCIRKNTSPPSNVNEAINVLKVLLASQKSLNEGKGGAI